MALRRYTVVVDGTIPIQALLYDDEDLLASQDNVGIYDGLQKAVNHQSGTVHVSSHRLFFVNTQKPVLHSFSMDLVHVTRTEHYAGLFTSSPKLTLYLSPSIDSSSRQNGAEIAFQSWTCEVCNHRNPPGLSPAAARICALCGVPRSALSSSPQPKPLGSPTTNSSTLLASSRSSTPAQHSNELASISCAACTFLNHPFLRNCEICATPLPLIPANSGLGSKSEPSSRPGSPLSEDNDLEEANPLIKLSFRKGGDKAFYNILRRALKARAWEGRRIGKRTQSGSSSLGFPSPEGGSTPGPLRPSGIDGILRNVAASAQNTETELSGAFKDLEALMIKAQDLVHLAAEMNEKLSVSYNNTPALPANPASQSSWIPPSSRNSTGLVTSSMFTTTSLVPSSEPEEVNFIRSSLAQLGLQLSNAPITADMMQDERKWTEELARELASVLQGSGDERVAQRTGGLMKDREIIGLDEVWGGWNRARGVALIPPSTFLQVLQHLSFHTSPPIRLRTFKSGLQVLHTPLFTHASFAARLSSYLKISGPQTTSQIALEERITIPLAAEMVLAVEADGHICRDDERSAIRGGGGAGGGFDPRWWPNIFGQYIWDGQMDDG